MPNCSVPLCTTQRSGKGISIHEFPSDLNLRVAWIRAVCRKDPETNNYWIPTESAGVCSRHFTPDQYCKNLKKRVLVPGSVPCVFPEYPMYLLQNSSFFKRFRSPPNNDTSNSSDNTGTTSVSNISYSDSNNANLDTNYDNIAIKNVQTSNKQSPGMHLNVMKICDASNTDVNNIQNCGIILKTMDSLNENTVENMPQTVVNEKYLSQMDTNNCFIDDHLQKRLKTSVSEDTPIQDTRFIKEIVLPTEMESTTMPGKHIVKPETGKNNDEISKKLKTKLQSAQRRVLRYKAQILKLKETNQILRETNDAIREKFKDYSIDELEKGIENSDRKALFIIDQLHSLRKKKILWSASTMEFVKCFEGKFPAAYNFLRKEDIISLPSRHILRFH